MTIRLRPAGVDGYRIRKKPVDTAVLFRGARRLPKVWVFGNLSKTELVEQMIAAGVENLSAHAARALPDSAATN